MEKKLVRDTQNSVLGGVCSGIANYFGIDPTLVRIIAVLIAIFTAVFPTVIAYLILWAVIPADTTVYGPAPQPYQAAYNEGYWAGYYEARDQTAPSQQYPRQPE